jgi:hypothetical protein
VSEHVKHSGQAIHSSCCGSPLTKCPVNGQKVQVVLKLTWLERHFVHPVLDCVHSRQFFTRHYSQRKLSFVTLHLFEVSHCLHEASGCSLLVPLQCVQTFKAVH